MMGTLKAVMFWRNFIRSKRAEKRWRESGRVVSMLGGTVLKSLWFARKAIRDRKKKEAAVAFQTYFRSCYERKQFIKRIEKVKKSSRMIKIAIDSMRAREGLKRWMDIKLEQRKVEMERLENEQPQPQPQKESLSKPKSAAATAQKESATKPNTVTVPVPISREEREEKEKKEKEYEDQLLREEIEHKKLL